MKEDNGGSGNVMLRRMELRRSTSMRVGWGNGARRRMRNCMRPRRRMLGKGYAKTYGDGGGRWRGKEHGGVSRGRGGVGVGEDLSQEVSPQFAIATPCITSWCLAVVRLCVALGRAAVAVVCPGVCQASVALHISGSVVVCAMSNCHHSIAQTVQPRYRWSNDLNTVRDCATQWDGHDQHVAVLMASGYKVIVHCLFCCLECTSVLPLCGWGGRVRKS